MAPFSVEPQKTQDEALDVYDLEDWTYRLALHPGGIWKTYKPPLHRCFREKIFLHAFSGRRRRGDIQYFLDIAAAKHDDCILHVVSLDIVIDATWGDVRAPGTQLFWLDGMKQGYIVGMLTGPPCNTWSRARKQAIPSAYGRCGPRVVREIHTMWGMPSLALRELDDVRVGNELLGFSLLGLIMLYLTNNIGLMEHPAESPDPDDASIWRLPLVALILALPGVSLERLCQGFCGAPKLKPTCILTVNCPNFVHVMHQWMLTKQAPHGGTILGLSPMGLLRQPN